MAKASTAKKEWKNWSWATPKGKVYTKGTWATRKEAEFAAQDLTGGFDYEVVPVFVTVRS